MKKQAHNKAGLHNSAKQFISYQPLPTHRQDKPKVDISDTFRTLLRGIEFASSGHDIMSQEKDPIIVPVCNLPQRFAEDLLPKFDDAEVKDLALDDKLRQVQAHIDTQLRYIEQLQCRIKQQQDQIRRYREELNGCILWIEEGLEVGFKSTLGQVKRMLSRWRGALQYKGSEAYNDWQRDGGSGSAVSGNGRNANGSGEDAARLESLGSELGE